MLPWESHVADSARKAMLSFLSGPDPEAEKALAIEASAGCRTILTGTWEHLFSCRTKLESGMSLWEVVI